MSDSIFCPNCGTKQEGTPKFCFACGANLSAILSRRSTQPTAPASTAPAPTAPSPPTAAAAPGATLPPPPWAAGSAPTPAPASAPAPAPPAAPAAWSVPSGQAQFQAPAGYGQQPPQPRMPLGHGGAIGVRPTGITIIAILEVIGGVLGLWGAKILWDDADLLNRICYGYCNTGNFMFYAAISLAGAIAAFVLAYGLWRLLPWAWIFGVVLCIVAVAANLLIAFGANAGNDMILSVAVNVGVDAAVLYYLNLNPVRTLFGRPPTTFLQPQPQGAPGAQVPQPAQPWAPAAQPQGPAPWAQPPQAPPAEQGTQAPQAPQQPQPPANPFQQPPQG